MWAQIFTSAASIRIVYRITRCLGLRCFFSVWGRGFHFPLWHYFLIYGSQCSVLSPGGSPVSTRPQEILPTVDTVKMGEIHEHLSHFSERTFSQCLEICFQVRTVFKTSDDPLPRISAWEDGREHETEIDWAATGKSIEFLKMPVSILRGLDPEAYFSWICFYVFMTIGSSAYDVLIEPELFCCWLLCM